MALTIEIPGRELIQLQFLLLDVNGTLSDRGTLMPGEHVLSRAPGVVNAQPADRAARALSGRPGAKDS